MTEEEQGAADVWARLYEKSPDDRGLAARRILELKRLYEDLSNEIDQERNERYDGGSA